MDNLKQMLDHMTNMGVVVISKSAHAVLYANETFRKSYSHAKSGVPLQDVLSADEDGRKILEALDELECGYETDRRYRLYMADFGGSTDVWFDEFEWEGEPAYVIYFALIYLNASEKYQSELTKVIGDMVSIVYPFVNVVNLTGNAHMVLSADEGYVLRKGDHGNFAEAMHRLAESIHPDYYAEFVKKSNPDYLLSVFASLPEVHQEFQMKMADGEYHWVAMRFVRVHTADKKRVSCVGLMRNIDYRMNMQHKLQMTLDAAYAAIPGGVVQFVIDEALSILHVNEEFCRLAEKTQEEYYKSGYAVHILEEDRKQTCAVIFDKAKTGEPFEVSYRIRLGKSGAVRWVQLSGVKIDKYEGKPVYLAIRMDITELKNTQVSLIEEQARADMALGATGNVRFEYDRKKDRLTVHYAASDVEGRTMHPFTAEHYLGSISRSGEVYADDVDTMLSVFGGDNREPIEIRMKYARMQEYQWFRIRSTDVENADGDTYIVGIIENIEKEKNLETTNAQLMEQMTFMFQDSFQRMYIIDMKEDTCQVIRLGVEHMRKKALIRKLSRITAAYERTRIHPADLDNFRAKCMYLSSPSAFSKGRVEICFEMRVRDGLGPDYHWYNIMIRPAEKNEGKLIMLAKCVDELREQQELQRRYAEQMKYQKFSEQIIDSLGTIVEFRDSDSGEHIMRTKQLTRILLNYLAAHDPEYGLTQDKIEKITMAAAMHDVGKISIPDAILNKPGRLTPEEYEIMKLHTVKGYDILNSIEIGQDNEFGDYCKEICRYHHERYDGSGYPDHLVGDAIPLWGQIVSIVDVYDALVSSRIYKPPYSHERAMEMIINGECGQFNPKLLQGLTACADELRACYE